MRPLVLLAIVGAFAGRALAGPPMHPIGDRHFDHDAHAKAIAARGGAAPACARCHPNRGTAGQLLDTGTSDTVDHGLCQGSGCHGDSFAKDTRCEVLKSSGRAQVCAVCHIKDTCFVPPPEPANRMPSRFAHGRHAAFSSSIEPECAMCHTRESGTAAPKDPHAACANCHAGGAKPAMTDCASCHDGKPGRAVPPPDEFHVTFVHPAHAALSKQSACTACHGQPRSADPDALLTPAMLGCQNACHDGKKAFAATGTACTRCHQGNAPAPKLAGGHPFSHAAHAGKGVAMTDCATCHVEKPDGTLAAPLEGKDHQPCAASGCHQSEYASRTPTICGVCHEQAVPWAKTVARATEASAKREWFQGIDHAAHVRALPGGSSNGTCQQCHGAQLAGAPPPRGHSACASCHGKGQPPPMTACPVCHTQTPPPHAPESAWSVAANFTPAPHATDPRSQGPTACVECHTSVATARDLAAVTAPTMQRCDGCHDGTHAFKTTGFGCARCHAKPAAPQVGMNP